MTELSAISGDDNHSPEQRARLEQRRLQRPGGAADPDGAAPRPAARTYPLSFGQQGQWFLEQLVPGTSVYHVPLATRLVGSLDVPALQRSLDALVARHEPLRTTFEVGDGAPRQVVGVSRSVEMSVLDLMAHPAAHRESRLQGLLRHEARRPFDLARDLMLRAALFRLEAEEHILLLVMHPIAADGWSVSILYQELSVLYEAFLRGAPGPLAALPLRYVDFAVQQRQESLDGAWAPQLAYWKAQLANIPAQLELPTDRPRPPNPSYAGAREEALLADDLVRRLSALGRQERTILFTTLLAAFQALLSRYTGQEDIVVGTMNAARNRGELEGLIGLFVGTLVLRADLSGELTFRQLLPRVRRVVRDAFANQQLPFERLVEELRPQHHPGQPPFFQVMFVLQDVPQRMLAFPGLTVERVPVGIGTSRVDLSILVVKEADGLRVAVEYNTDLFDAATIGRFLGHYQTLLASIVADPDRPIGTLAILTAAERQQLQSDWNRTQRPFPRELGIAQLFEAQVERTPDAVAVIDGDRQLSYRDLNRRANRLARQLVGLGVQTEDCVGLCLERCLEMLVGILAILKAGGAYVSLDPNDSAEHRTFQWRDTGTKIVLTRQALADRLREDGPPLLLLDAASSARAGDDEDNLPAHGGGDRLAMVFYTSGSTGQPKGVLVPHRGVSRLLMNTDYIDVQPSDCLAQLAHGSFDGMTFEVWGALLHGARLVILSRETILAPHEFAEQVRRHQITVMFITTSLFNQLVQIVPSMFHSLRDLLVGGEALEPRWISQVLRHGPPRRLVNIYGPTETTTFATWHRIEQVPEGATNIPIGRPIANTQVYILDRRLQPVPVGVPGELCIGGPGVARGYLNRPDATAEKFIADPITDEPGTRLYRTGDQARFLADGTIEFLGRRDSQVKIRGFRIELDGIEAVLNQHPAVRASAVLVRGDAAADRRLVAYLACSPGHAPTVDELRDYLARNLPAYMVPSAVVVLDSLPLNRSGKVDRAALKMSAAVPPQPVDPATQEPISSIQARVRALWEELLDVHPIGIHDDFFLQGGHSLLAVRMMARVEQVLGQKATLSTFYAGPTIAQLVRSLSPSDTARSPIRVAVVKAGAKRRPYFHLHGDLMGGRYCQQMAPHLAPDQPLCVLPPHGVETMDIPRTVEAMAAEHLAALRAFQPRGPYLLGGFCNGAFVAFEMAQQLLERGEEVPLLVLMAAQAQQTLFRRSAHYFDVGRYQELYPPQAGTVPPFDLADVPFGENFNAKLTVYGTAIGNYFLRTYPGRVVVLAPVEESAEDGSLGWKSVAADIEVHRIPGGHVTCYKVHFQALAQQIQQCLDRAT